MGKRGVEGGGGYHWGVRHSETMAANRSKHSDGRCGVEILYA